MAGRKGAMKLRQINMPDEMWDAVEAEAEAVQKEKGGILSKSAVVRASLRETLGLSEDAGVDG